MPRNFETRLRLLADSFVGAMLGAGVYAAWAIFANWDYGLRVALSVGFAHWLASTFLTYTGTGVMRQGFGLVSRKWDAAFIAFFSGLAYTYAVLLCVHLSIGTPHLALTLAAGVIPNVLFCSSYSLLLVRTAASSNGAELDVAIERIPS